MSRATVSKMPQSTDSGAEPPFMSRTCETEQRNFPKCSWRFKTRTPGPVVIRVVVCFY